MQECSLRAVGLWGLPYTVGAFKTTPTGALLVESKETPIHLWLMVVGNILKSPLGFVGKLTTWLTIMV